MDIVLEQAKKFSEVRFRDVTKYEFLLRDAKDKVASFDNPLDKIKFINYILSKNNANYEKHKPACKSPENCRYNYAYESIAYYLTQELNRLGVGFNDDTFTDDDKNTTDKKLDQILKDLKQMKAGQQVIYEDLSKEIEELRTLYFLGKKKWHQLLLGKSAEMVISGVISEGASKHIINIAQKAMHNLLQ